MGKAKPRRDPEKERLRKRAWRVANPEYHRRYRADNREKRNASARRRYAANIDKERERARRRSSKRYSANREALARKSRERERRLPRDRREYRKRYYAVHRTEAIAKSRAWYATNHEKARERDRRYRNRITATEWSRIADAVEAKIKKTKKGKRK